MYSAPGELAYHYTSREAAFGHILVARSLRLSALGSMRDPVENKDWVQTLYARGTDRTPAEALYRAARDTLFKTKLLSFTLDAPADPAGGPAEYTRGYARPRMWEQYAENHQGVCLAFDRVGLTEHLMSILRAFGHVVSGPVVYSNTPRPGSEAARILDADQLRDAAAGDLTVGLREHLRAHAPELFFRKLEDWKTERELRFVVLDEDKLSTTVALGDSLRGVILGELFPSWQVSGAAEICRSLAVDLRQMQWGAFPPGVFDPIAAGPPEPIHWVVEEESSR